MHRLGRDQVDLAHVIIDVLLDHVQYDHALSESGDGLVGYFYFASAHIGGFGHLANLFVLIDHLMLHVCLPFEPLGEEVLRLLLEHFLDLIVQVNRFSVLLG